MNATDDELRASVESCENATEWSIVVVICGLVTESFLAAWHPPFDSFAGIWGSVIADTLVPLGVAGELLFSKMGSSRQRELQRRSDEKVAEANERAEEAGARALEAQAQLAKFKAPRVLSQEQLSRIIEKMRPFAGMPYDFAIQVAPKSINLMVQIGDALNSAGLHWVRGTMPQQLRYLNPLANHKLELSLSAGSQSKSMTQRPQSGASRSPHCVTRSILRMLLPRRGDS